MSQRTRPDADVSVDGWSPTPVYVHLDEPEPDDGDYVSCTVPPSASFLVHLTGVGAPIAGQIEYEAQPHRLVVRLAGSACTQATVALLNTIEGADVWIKSQSFDLTEDFRDCELVLSYPEAARIEDYEALKVLVSATGDGSCSSSSAASSHSSGSGSGSWSGSGSDSGSWSGGSASASSSNSGSQSGGSASYSASGSGSGTSSSVSSGGSGSASHSSAGSGGSPSGSDWSSSSDASSDASHASDSSASASSSDSSESRSSDSSASGLISTSVSIQPIEQ